MADVEDTEGAPLLDRSSVPQLLHRRGVVVRANAALRRWLGIEVSAGTPVSALVPEEETESFVRCLRAAPTPSGHLQRFRGASGETRLARVMPGSPHADGLTVAAILPQPASNRPAELLPLLEAAVDHLEDMILITEAESLEGRGRRVVYVNRAFTAHTGFEALEALGRTPNLTFGEQTDPEILARIARGLSRREPVHERLRKHRADGSAYWCDLDIAPVYDEDGRHTHWVSVQRDVSEAVELHAHVAREDKLASLGTLAASIGHEINNPLTYVIGNLELLARELGRLGDAVAPRSRAAMERRIGEALDGARRVGQIARDITQFSRDDAAEEAGPVDVCAAVEIALRLAEPETRHRARVRCELAPAQPVVASERRLCQVFVNLIVNAAHAITPGRCDEELITVRVHPDGDHVCVEVADTGGGIPPAQLGRIFEPFFTTKRPGVGSGLGLYICHSVIDGAGGTLEVDSELGRGTTFRVRLPAAAQAVSDMRRPVSGIAMRTTARRARVLVIDDEESIRTMVASTLDVHEVATAAGVQDALARLAEERFDAILCDLMMPDGTGMDLFRVLRERGDPQAERMVFFSGAAYTEPVRAFLDRLPPERYLQKPFRLSALEARIEGVLAADPRHARTA